MECDLILAQLRPGQGAFDGMGPSFWLWAVFWSLVGGIIGTVINVRKGWDGVIGFIGGAVLGPVFVWLFLIQADNQLGLGLRKCPFCAELVKAEASICRYCREELPVKRRKAHAQELPRSPIPKAARVDPNGFVMSDEDGSLEILEQDSKSKPDSQSIPIAPEAVPVPTTPVAAEAVPVVPPTKLTPVVAPEAVPVTPTSIRFSCPSCQHALSAPGDKAGVLTKCRYCKNPVTIPQAS